MITVVGEALIDLIGAESGTYRATPGGAPANTAVALARLGVPVRLLARIGADQFGRRLRGYIGGCGVDTSALVMASEPSTLAIASLDSTGHAEYDFYIRGTADWQWRSHELPDPIDTEVTTLHVGSLAMALPPGAAILEEWVTRQRERATVSYDPNIRPALAGDPAAARARVERQVALADIVKASDEDLRWLYPERPLDRAIRDWATLGPTLVVVTQGSEDTLVAHRGGPASAAVVSRHTPLPAEVVDTVGAGDAFAAGLLDALGQAGVLGAKRRSSLAGLRAEDLTVCLEHAHRVAARTCERVGADPGVLELAPLRFPR